MSDQPKRVVVVICEGDGQLHNVYVSDPSIKVEVLGDRDKIDDKASLTKAY